jgi:hypothetical protein
MKKVWIFYQVSRRLEELKQEYNKKDGKPSLSIEIKGNQKQVQWRFFSSFVGEKPWVIHTFWFFYSFVLNHLIVWKYVHQVWTSVMALIVHSCLVKLKCPWNFRATQVVTSSHLLLGWDSLFNCNLLTMIVIKMMTRFGAFSAMITYNFCIINSGACLIPWICLPPL